MKTDSTYTARIAYLSGEYPMVSLTFIQREIAALRALGLEIITCTVRRAKNVVKDQKEEERQTFCIIEQAIKPHVLLYCHFFLFFRSPSRWIEALIVAIKTGSPGLKARIYQIFYFFEAGVLAKYMIDQRVSHLHNHFGSSSCSVAMIASVISGIPFSFTDHGPDVFFEPYRWRLDEKIKRAKFVVAISHFCRSQLMIFSDMTYWKKISIVHCGVDIKKFQRVRDPHTRKNVLFVGRITPVKGVPLLLEAFVAVRERHPDARLTIVGDGAKRADAEQQARALGLGDIVTFAGYKTQAEVAELLETSDLLVLPSFAEGVPVVLMEAMASRIPVIASRVAGVQELVRDGETGYTVPPGDVATLSDRISHLLADPDLCRRMGEAGRAVVEAEFNLDKEAAWLATFFAEPPRSLRPADLSDAQRQSP